MELLWLEDFLNLARTGSFSKSAIERHVTQSGFSRRIRALESWMGVQLVDRRTFPASLTPAGVAFQKTAGDIVHQLYRDRSEFQGVFTKNQADVRIAAATTLLLKFIPQWLSSIKRQLGEFSATVKTQNFHDMVQSLADGNTDFVLQYFHPEIPLLFELNSFDSTTLAVERFIPVTVADAAGKPRHRLPGKKTSSLPYMGYSTDGYLSRVESFIIQANQDKALYLEQCNESPTAEVLKVFVIEEQGFAWLPESCARSELASGVLVPAGGPEWETTLEVQMYRSRKQSNAWAQDIWKYIRGSSDNPACS